MLMIRTCAALAIAAAITASALPAHAQANCDMYGKLALQQQKENASNKCGFTGPEWNPELKAHIDWCAGVGPDQWKAQLQARQQKLDACKAK